MLALSDSKIHLLRPTKFSGVRREALELVHTFERSHVHVTARAGVALRHLVIEDLRTGETFELESERSWRSHGEEIVAAVVADALEEDAPDEPEDEDTGPA